MPASKESDDKRLLLKVGLGFLGVVALLGVCGIGAFAYGIAEGFQRTVSRASDPPTEPGYVLVAGSDLETFGQQIAGQLAASDWAAVDADMDWEALGFRTSEAMHHSGRPGLLPGAVDGARQLGFSTVMHGGQPEGSSFSYRGIFPRDGASRLRFRHLMQSGGFQFAELLVGVRPGAEPRVVDVWSLTTGEDLSSTMAEGLGGVAAANPDFLRRLNGERNPWDDHGQDVQRAQTLFNTGHAAEGLQLLDALPPVMRDSRMVSLLRVRLASAGDPARYVEVLDEVAALRPNDPAVLAMLVDRHALAQEWSKVADDVRRLEEDVADPYLDTYQARMEHLAGHADRARALVDAAVLAEPDLLDAHDVRMVVALGQGDTVVADQELQVLRQQFQIDLERLATMEGYDAIRTLPSFPSTSPLR